MGKENPLITALKGALLLEYKGKDLYQSVIDTSSHAAIRELFAFLRDEEEDHIKTLKNHYRQVARGQELHFDPPPEERERDHPVLTEKITAEISGAGYEAAVISAALELEKKAVEYYAEQAGSAPGPDEKNLFSWLSAWEKKHMMMLARLDDELKEKIWYDNQFWPLD